MKTLLLCAGGDSAFADPTYHYPKNLVEVGGQPLVQHAIDNLGSLAHDGRLVVVLRKDEARAFHTPRVVRLIQPTAQVVLAGTTSGAASSALLAVEEVDSDEPLLVCNGDQVLDLDLPAVVARFEADGLDAGVVTFEAVHPRWSYVRTEAGLVVEASEKRPISTCATAGFYWFRRAGDFFAATMAMICKGGAVEGAYYVCPALNELVLDGKRIGIHPIERERYFSLHNPAGVAVYERFLSHQRPGRLASVREFSR
ncbi:MAG TPA: glycosyltransferase family 2 protein [Jatrophihabitantaceae bacterium]|nr:glycosyltransferase family 2 protein [Jatrophihabitantaceae bacterium]